MSCKQFFSRRMAFLVPFLLFFATGICALILYSKKDIHLFINGMNSSSMDVFFRYATEFGTFLVIGPALLILLFVRYRYALVVGVSSLFSMILTQVLKRLVFVDMPRPKIVFDLSPELHWVEGVRLHSAHSFPSGHTAAAFALFAALAFLSRKPATQFVCFVVALLVGYSRMYLSQHFLMDVVVGSLIGTVSAWAAWALFYRGKLSRVEGLDLALFAKKR